MSLQLIFHRLIQAGGRAGWTARIQILVAQKCHGRPDNVQTAVWHQRTVGERFLQGISRSGRKIIAHYERGPLIGGVFGMRRPRRWQVSRILPFPSGVG